MKSSQGVLFFGLAIAVISAMAQTQDQGLVNAPGAGRPISTPVEFSGKVVLEDATPPPQPAFIRASCGAAGVQETHTDKKGRFELMFGSFTPAPTGWNALGTPNNRGEAYTCEMSVSLDGFRTVKLVTRSGDLGIVVLKPLGARDGYTISVNNALAPAEAKLAYDRARQLIAKGKLQEATKELSKAVELYPKYASAWTELGKIQMNANELSAARLSLEKAIEADSKYLPPYEQLMMLALREEKWHELAEVSDRIIGLNAFDYPEAYYLNAVAHLNLNHPEAAEKSAREALKQDPRKFVRAHYVLGLALARQGQLLPAAGELKAYLAAADKLTESEIQTIERQIREVETLASHMNSARHQ
jgi:tetratricopeptide (TPR) repeat protein